MSPMPGARRHETSNRPQQRGQPHICQGEIATKQHLGGVWPPPCRGLTALASPVVGQADLDQMCAGWREGERVLTGSIIGMVRRRWGSERPFEGHSAESLLRKINSPATQEAVREAARRELQLRNQLELPRR